MKVRIVESYTFCKIYNLYYEFFKTSFNIMRKEFIYIK